MATYYRIEKEELAELLEDHALLEQLHSLGVENWHGYTEVEYPEDVTVEKHIHKNFRMIED